MKYALLPLMLAALALGGCTGPVIAGGTAGMMWWTRPSEPPEADTESQIPQHEVWCYKTMGDPQCYAEAQDVPQGRLINVDPQNRYPLTAQAYRNELARKNAVTPFAADAPPVVLNTVETLPVEKKDLNPASATGSKPVHSLAD